MEETAEGAVTRDAAFTVTEEVDGSEIAVLAIWSGKILEEGGIIEVCDCPGIIDAERIECICERQAVIEEILGFTEKGLIDRNDRFVLAVGGVEEGDIVGDE